MTTDPTRAAEIVVASKEARSAAADLYLAQQGEPHSPHDLATAEAIRSGLNDHWEVVQAFARFERDHMQRPTDTARAGEAWPPSEQRWNDDLASIVEALWGASTANLIRAGKLNREEINAKYALRDVILKYLQPATPSPVTDEAALSAEAKARQLLAATINREVFPGKAEHLLSGKDDLLFDARPALDAIIAALASTPQPAAAETVERAVSALEQIEEDNMDGEEAAQCARQALTVIRQSAKGGK